MLFPLEKYIQAIHRAGIAYSYRIYEPPQPISNPMNRDLVEAIQKEHRITACVMFVHLYLHHIGHIDDFPSSLPKIIRYTPIYLFAMLEQKGWTSEFYAK